MLVLSLELLDSTEVHKKVLITKYCFLIWTTEHNKPNKESTILIIEVLEGTLGLFRSIKACVIQ